MDEPLILPAFAGLPGGIGELVRGSNERMGIVHIPRFAYRGGMVAVVAFIVFVERLNGESVQSARRWAGG